MNYYFQPIDVTLTDATNLRQNVPDGNGTERIVHICQRFKTFFSPSDTTYCHTHNTRWNGVLTPLQSCSQCILHTPD